MTLLGIITLLIYILLFAAVVYLVIWVLRDIIGLALPEKVIQILWAVFALIALYLVVQFLLGGAGGGLRLPALR